MITEVKDFFPQEILDKILFIANNNEYEDINYSVTSGIRKRLDLWSLDISKDIKQFCNLYIGLGLPAVDHPIIINHIFLWKDEPGFSMASHVDNYGTHLAIQIYLNDNDNSGIVFNVDGSEKVIKYGLNRGYINYNYIEPRIPHIVPECKYERLSIYIICLTVDQDGNMIGRANEQF